MAPDGNTRRNKLTQFKVDMILMYLKLQRSLGVENPRRRRKRMLNLISLDSFLSCFPSGWACTCACVCVHTCVCQ